ncbi:CG3548, partial [Drosophila busckii]
MKLEELLTKGASSPQDDEDDDEKAESKTKATNDGGGENVSDAAEEESTEKESATGKKKGTRKKRSLNWEEAERGLLLEVIKTKVAFVENRSVDAKSIKAKRLAWSQITKQFNNLNFRHRLLEQIQVQWRSMKNSAKREHQQKHPKSEHLEGMRMIEFMEELQKDPVTSRSQTRSGTNGAANPGSVPLKKDLIEIDEDEDMPLAALPNSTNASEDTLQTSTIAIPSPPPSTGGGDSQQENAQSSTHSQSGTSRRRRTKAKPSLSSKEDADTIVATADNDKSSPVRKRRQRNHSQAQSVLSDDFKIDSPEHISTITTAAVTEPISHVEIEEKYKQQLFKLLKQARLAEMDYARREHEQKLRFEQMEQELKMSYYRQEQDLKLRHMREEHDMRLRQQRREHEARINVYNGEAQQQLTHSQLTMGGRCNTKMEYNNVQQQPTTSASSHSMESALALNANSL